MPDGMYSYGRDIQRKMLSLLWLDQDSWLTYYGCMKPKYFEYDVHMDICREVLGHYEKFSELPTPRIVEEKITAMIEKSKMKAERKAEYLAELNQMRRYDPAELLYLRDNIVTFAKRQALSDALVQSADNLAAGKDVDKIEYIISNALAVGEHIDENGVVLLDKDEIEKRVAMYQTGEDVVERISTGSDLLDTIMYGGLGRGELGIILAPPGFGKTTTLLNFSVGALRKGKNSLHITFENNEYQTMRNYDCCLLDRNKEFLSDPDNTDVIKTCLNRFKTPDLNYGNIIIKKFEVKSMSIGDLKTWIRKLINHHKGEFTPDVIIVDYGGLVRPDSNTYDRRFQLEQIYEGLRNLAEVFNCAVWTGAQGNRGSLSKKIVTMADLAEAFNIANTADFMMALCQTEREKSEGIMRYFITKQREDRDSILLSGGIKYPEKRITIDKEIDQFTINRAENNKEVDIYMDDD